jgi:hypothetical protein
MCFNKASLNSLSLALLILIYASLQAFSGLYYKTITIVSDDPK